VNAAARLAELLEAWRVPQGFSPLDVRDSAKDDAAAFWRSQADAVALVRECDSAVLAMRQSGLEVRGWTPYVAEWYAAVFSANLPWRSNVVASAGSGAISPEALAALHSLSPWLSLNAAGSATEEQRHAFGALLGQLDALLVECADDLSDQERQYVLRLLGAARELLEEKKVLRDSDLREHLDTLNGALLRIGKTLNDSGKTEKAKKVFGLVVDLLNFGTGVLTLGQAGVEAYATVFKALGGQ
jgi:hypothetical protein